MGILTRLVDSVAPEVLVAVRGVRRPRKRAPSSAGNEYARRFINEQRLSDRQIHELIGVCCGVLADGAVVQPEAKFLLGWLERNRECSGTWPHNFLYERIARILADGRITDEEEKELLDTIAKVAGVPTDEGSVGSHRMDALDARPQDREGDAASGRGRAACAGRGGALGAVCVASSARAADH